MAMDVLDEMVAVLDECDAVLLMLGEEAALNLDELAQFIEIARDETVNAFKAASLLHRYAALSESWTNARSRPRAVFARHAAAVRSGAPRIKPAAPSVRFPPDEDVDMSVATGTQDLMSGERAERPQCVAIAKSTGRACANPAACIGPNEFLRHCYGHLEPEERELFNAHRDRVAELTMVQRAAAVNDLLENGRMVAAEWMERRRLRTQLDE